MYFVQTTVTGPLQMGIVAQHSKAYWAVLMFGYVEGTSFAIAYCAGGNTYNIAYYG